MSEFDAIAVLGCVFAVCVVAFCATYAYVEREPKHVHEWQFISAAITEIYGDKWGHSTSKVTRRETDISGICATCRQPLHRRVEGVWQMPIKRATRPDPTTTPEREETDHG